MSNLVEAIQQVKTRVEPLLIRLGLVLAAIFVAWMFLSSIQITIEALIDGRPWSWWVRTDYCPEPNQVCGGMAWIIFVPFQILFVFGLIGVAIRGFEKVFR